MEFRDLSRSLGDPRYEDAADRVSQIVHGLPKQDGLVPIFINANSGVKLWLINGMFVLRLRSRLFSL